LPLYRDNTLSGPTRAAPQVDRDERSVVAQRRYAIVNTYKGLVAQGKEKFAADPFLTATAEVHKYTVVTEESGPDILWKIPGVCRALNVPSINLMPLFDAEDWIIG
jgi:hypothetical protein